MSMQDTTCQSSADSPLHVCTYYVLNTHAGATVVTFDIKIHYHTTVNIIMEGVIYNVGGGGTNTGI